jgi:hypothetical protein
MSSMFDCASSFNSSLDDWNVSKKAKTSHMFLHSKLEKLGNLPDWL